MYIIQNGTLAAICGGTTTVIDFATQDRGRCLTRALELWHKKAEGRSSCNYAFHVAITDWNETVRRELRDMIAAGVTSVKTGMWWSSSSGKSWPGGTLARRATPFSALRRRRPRRSAGTAASPSWPDAR